MNITETKPFALFSGQRYYAACAFQNHIDQFSTEEEAVEAGKKLIDGMEWYQVVDLRIPAIVAGEGSSHTGLFGEFPANPNNPAVIKGD